MTVLSYTIEHVGKRYFEFGLAKYDTTEQGADVPSALRTVDSAQATAIGADEILSINETVTVNANNSGFGAIIPNTITSQTSGRKVTVHRPAAGSSGLTFSYLFIGRK